MEKLISLCSVVTKLKVDYVLHTTKPLFVNQNIKKEKKLYK